MHKGSKGGAVARPPPAPPPWIRHWQSLLHCTHTVQIKCIFESANLKMTSTCINTFYGIVGFYKVGRAESCNFTTYCKFLTEKIMSTQNFAPTQTKLEVFHPKSCIFRQKFSDNKNIFQQFSNSPKCRGGNCPLCPGRDTTACCMPQEKLFPANYRQCMHHDQ